MNTKRFFRLLLNSSFILAFLFMTLPVSPVFAAPGCSGTGCDGKDPYTMKCAGSGASYGVVATTNIYDSKTGKYLGYTQLWWSTTCKTNWSRTVITNTSGLQFTVTQVINSSNRVYQNLVAGYVTEVRSPMVYAPTTKYRSCAYLVRYDQSDSHACTAYK